MAKTDTTVHVRNDDPVSTKVRDLGPNLGIAAILTFDETELHGTTWIVPRAKAHEVAAAFQALAVELSRLAFEFAPRWESDDDMERDADQVKDEMREFQDRG